MRATSEDADFELFDKTAKFDDTDDRPRGAAAKSTQLSIVTEDGTTVFVKSKSDGNGHYYDRDPNDEFQPGAGTGSILEVTIEVASGKAFFSLLGRSMARRAEADRPLAAGSP